MKFGFVIVLALAAFAPSQAQLSAPNEAGVAWGHWHFNAKDVDAQTAFWKALGGVPAENGQLKMISFPGTLILVRKADSPAPTPGSVVNHVGFFVKDLAAAKARWGAAGLNLEISNPTAPNFFVIGPDGIRVEIYENKDLDVPIATHHNHFWGDDTEAMQAWYIKWFGGVAGKRGTFITAQVPGMELAFQHPQVPGPQAPTKGRALDHIGFEVKNLPAFVAKLQAGGIKLDSAPRTLPNSNTMICFLTDPWGTYIELTENLAPPAK
jgi:catechol 2,3-dioxygenase-like lactoylglutathione lyase family enzyme